MSNMSVWIFLLAIIGIWYVGHSEGECTESCLEVKNTDYPGNNIEEIQLGHRNGFAETCAFLCGTTEGCNFWSFSISVSRCSLKSAKTSTTSTPYITSGNKACGMRDSSCPAGWSTVTMGDGYTKCYLIINTGKMSFNQAITSCQNEGGHVVTLNGQDEVNTVSKFYKDSKMSGWVWLPATPSGRDLEWMGGWGTCRKHNFGPHEDCCMVWNGENYFKGVKCGTSRYQTLCDRPAPICGRGGNGGTEGTEPTNCECSDQIKKDHNDKDIGACLTQFGGKHWCYVPADSECSDKKESSREKGLFWSAAACTDYSGAPIRG